MLVQNLRHSAMAILATMGLAGPSASYAAGKIKVDSVPPEVRTTAGNEMPRPVSMQAYYFEVNKETQRARIVVDYSYPGEAVDYPDAGAAPEPTLKQVPGLQYDAEAKTVVYEGNGKRTVCATVEDHKFLFWKTSVAKPTGSCTVTSELAYHFYDNGWGITHVRAIDTYFEVK